MTIDVTGVHTEKHSATLSAGSPGVLHGVRTYLLQSPAGQIIETHSVSAGLDYPGVGPEHAWLKDSGRAEYIVATDEDALRGFRMCTQLEGIIPGEQYDWYGKWRQAKADFEMITALESAHAVWGAVQLAKTLPKSHDVVVVSCSSSQVVERNLKSDPDRSVFRVAGTRTWSKSRSCCQESGRTYWTGTYNRFLWIPSTSHSIEREVAYLKCELGLASRS